MFGGVEVFLTWTEFCCVLGYNGIYFAGRCEPFGCAYCLHSKDSKRAVIIVQHLIKLHDGVSDM
jgi:hypothetical protein